MNINLRFKDKNFMIFLQIFVSSNTNELININTYD